jgi:hypothetical protein
MSYSETRELIRLRYELRRLLAERPRGADVTAHLTDHIGAEARALFARIQELVATDAEEAAIVSGELARWQISLALAP